MGQQRPTESGQGNLNATAHAHPAVNVSKFTRIITPQIHFPERNFISIAYLTFDVFVLCIFVLKTPEKIN